MWPDQPELNEYVQGSPMIAIEIASRGNTAEEIERKTGGLAESSPLSEPGIEMTDLINRGVRSLLKGP